MDAYNAESVSHRERCKNVIIRQYEIGKSNEKSKQEKF